MSIVIRHKAPYCSENPKNNIWSCEVSRYNTAFFFACQRRTATADGQLKKKFKHVKWYLDYYVLIGTTCMTFLNPLRKKKFIVQFIVQLI